MKNRKRRPGERSLVDQGDYDCPSCGESIVIPIDLSAGAIQTYVEDCPVCCRPNRIHVELDENDQPRIWAEPD